MSLSVTAVDGETWSSTAPLCCITRGDVTTWPRRLLHRAKLLLEVLRFERLARDFLLQQRGEEDAPFCEMSVQHWLDAHGFSSRVATQFVGPMVGAIWSRGDDVLAKFPMAGVATFLRNHFMLQRRRPRWRTPKHRSQDYVNTLIAHVGRRNFVTNFRVVSLAPSSTCKWRIVSDNCVTDEEFEFVLFACPADCAAAVIAATPSSSGLMHIAKVLRKFSTTANDVCVHRDAALMPPDRTAWAAWNALPGGVVTYWVNALQPGASTNSDLFVTLNAVPADQCSILWRKMLSHPILDGAAANGRREIPQIQGLANCFFAGAWCGYGFHEDGLRSAVGAVEALIDMVSPDDRCPGSANVGVGCAYSVALSPTTLPSQLSVASRFALALRTRALRRAVAAAFDEGYAGGPEIAIELPGGSDVIITAGSSPMNRRVAIRVRDERGLHLFQRDSLELASAFSLGSVDVAPSVCRAVVAAIRFGNWQKDVPRAIRLNLGVVVANFRDAALRSIRAHSKGDLLREIDAQYDVLNSFFGLFLDGSMSYSAALYPAESDGDYLGQYEDRADERSTWCDDSIEPLTDAREEWIKTAQLAKLDALIDAAGICNGDRVLEIGCGWLSLGLRCCDRFADCQYVATTSSKEQLYEAMRRIRTYPVGCRKRISVVLCDYRDAYEALNCALTPFDRILCCEMIEAVGHTFLSGFLNVIHACLRPGGAAAFHLITTHDLFSHDSNVLRRSQFQDNSLAGLKAVQAALPYSRANDGTLYSLHLDTTSTRRLGVCYARTLRAWRERFEAHLESVAELGLDDTFKRTWSLYLEYCEAGFAMQHIDVYQLDLVKTCHASAEPLPQKDNTSQGSVPRRVRDSVIKIAQSMATIALYIGALSDTLLRFCVWTVNIMRKLEELGWFTDLRDALYSTIQKLPKAVKVSDMRSFLDTHFYGLLSTQRIDLEGQHLQHGGSGNTTQQCTPAPLVGLPSTEAAALAKVCLRADIDSTTRSILIVGDGWGLTYIFLAERFPSVKVVGLSKSNSTNSDVMCHARSRGLINLRMAAVELYSDLNPSLAALRILEDSDDATFDLAISCEVPKGMSDCGALFSKIAGVLTPRSGKLFVQTFSRQQEPPHFAAESELESDMNFSGVLIPSSNFISYQLAQPRVEFSVLGHWCSSGSYYVPAAEGWLASMESRRDEIIAMFAEKYPDPAFWWSRWRAFLISLQHHSKIPDGCERHLVQYLLQVRDAIVVPRIPGKSSFGVS
mmetsp:Transcript_6042/g.19682  ORF Transcript_6042/g.19682 Transcript_6042/m.19682 type:complete len:1245 (-) Transcript_6042:569-4303(-)